MLCFVSCSFHEEEDDVRNWFDAFLNAFSNITTIYARHDPISVPEKVREQLEKADFFCAIVTRRGDKVPPWVLSEIAMAHSQRMMITAFVEDGIPTKDLGILPTITVYQEFQRSSLGRRAPEYVEYICNARARLLKDKRLDRTTLLEKVTELSECVKQLNREIEIQNMMLAPRDFDPREEPISSRS